MSDDITVNKEETTLTELLKMNIKIQGYQLALIMISCIGLGLLLR